MFKIIKFSTPTRSLPTILHKQDLIFEEDGENYFQCYFGYLFKSIYKWS